MDISTVEQNGLTTTYSVSIPSSAIIPAVEERIREIAKTYTLAGFREGKVPLSIVRGQVGKEVLSKQIDEQVNQALQFIIKDKGIIIAGTPQVEVHEFNPETNLRFTIKVETMPEVEDLDLSHQAFQDIKFFELQVEADDIEKARQELKKSARKYKEQPAEYAAKHKDGIVIDFHGTVDGKEFEGNNASELRVVIGDEEFLADLEQGLLGMRAGEEKNISVTFPSDYYVSDIANKTAIFKVKAHNVLSLEEETEIDDAFAQNMGFKDLQQLIEAIEAKMKFDFAVSIRNETKRRFFDAVVKTSSANIPEHMIESDYKNMLEEYEKSSNQSMTKEELRALAERRVILGVTLANYAKKHNISVTQEEIKKLEEAEIARGRESAETIKKFYASPDNVVRMHAALLEDKCLQEMISKIPNRQEIKVTMKEYEEKYAAQYGQIQSN